MQDTVNVVNNLLDTLPEGASTEGALAKAAEKMPLDSWNEMLMATAFGFVTVLFVLVLLIYIMKTMGWFFTRERKAKVAASSSKQDHEDAISDEELTAAIATALKLYKSEMHDRESEMLTINRITRAYSPWNSKIHGLTQVPEKK